MVSEGDVCKDDKTLVASLPPPPKLAAHPNITRHDALTFDPSPPLEEEDEYSVATPDDQSELMCWHYHLGHVPFSKLKRLATNGRFHKDSPLFVPLTALATSLGP